MRLPAVTGDSATVLRAAVELNKSGYTRQWLEDRGWRFLGFNAAKRQAFYANLNFNNTCETFTQREALIVTVGLFLIAHGKIKPSGPPHEYVLALDRALRARNHSMTELLVRMMS